jgi:simple sugar transport system ATP-binding protein
MDIAGMRTTAKQELLDMGIDLRDVDQPIGTLSGGERQCVAIARAVHFGAKVLILDEPTAALGVKQSGVVLRYIIQAKERGLGVIFITHNPHHAYPVGDDFLILKRGRSLGYWHKSEITMGELTGLMAGGTELEELTHELEAAGTESSGLREVAQVFEQEVAELHVGERSGPGQEAVPSDNTGTRPNPPPPQP